ncbi:uncharacterized protein V6R79_000473 [Siganus canaliculatus]
MESRYCRYCCCRCLRAVTLCVVYAYSRSDDEGMCEHVYTDISGLRLQIKMSDNYSERMLILQHILTKIYPGLLQGRGQQHGRICQKIELIFIVRHLCSSPFTLIYYQRCLLCTEDSHFKLKHVDRFPALLSCIEFSNFLNVLSSTSVY